MFILQRCSFKKMHTYTFKSMDGKTTSLTSGPGKTGQPLVKEWN